ncbi:hypothetical protein PMG11_07148 [Penicillium brasilianum]|uniref:Farnesyl pyrophosphate synthase n=1 Tax=Penicillium brasilianum TaxID=104259 RepID=A0A0F7TP61_PENBI|nr:hypothetical protein PMG11_07148 [Penicillium brasilianum]
MFRSRTVVQTGLMLSNHDCTPQQVEDLQILGSLIDFENAAYCVRDEIMDNSTTRRGLLCWYRRDRVGLMAVNDGCLLKSMISLMVTKHFKSHPIYFPLLELLNDASLRTELGQNIDLMAAEKLVSLEQFTDDRYQWIIEHKTAYYTFYVPFAIPFIYLGLATPKKLEGIYQIRMLFGLIFQARDDFLDVYGECEDDWKDRD